MGIRVIILSDTHGALDARIVERVRATDVVVHAGDIGDRGVLDTLKPLAERVIAVRGNNDVREKWKPADWALLESLPWEASLPLPGGELVVVHGHRYGNPGRHHERMRRDYSGARVIVYGHSHRECSDRTRVPWVLNPGAAGRVRTFGGPSCYILHASEKRWALKSHRFPPPL